jgi:hypothetical protein
MDHEFFESSLVPDVLLEGFPGFRPSGDGFSITPRLPTTIESVEIDGIRFRDETLAIRAGKWTIEIRRDHPASTATLITVPEGFGIDGDHALSDTSNSPAFGRSYLWTADQGTRISFAKKS